MAGRAGVISALHPAALHDPGNARSIFDLVDPQRGAEDDEKTTVRKITMEPHIQRCLNVVGRRGIAYTSRIEPFL